MTGKEKILLLASINNASSNKELSEQIIAAAKKGLRVGYDLKKNKAYIKRNLREEIKAKLKSEDISLRQFAIALNIDYMSFHSYLKGLRGLPYDDLENVLGVLEL